MKRIPALILLAVMSFSVAMAADRNTTKADVLTKSTKSWDESVLPAYPTDAPEITMVRLTIPAGGKLPMHKHPVIAAGYLVSGQLTVEDEQGKKLDVKAGDALLSLVDKWHAVHNPGDKTAEIVLFYAGSANVPHTITKP